jgi:hypothetical protein
MAGDRPAALVTGSASGIGRAAALRLARAGYDVAINYRRSQDSARRTVAELESLGGRHLALRGDVSDDAAVAAMVAAVDDAYGRLDVLVNNAGMTSSTPPEDLDGVDLAEWDRVFAVNVRGLFQVTRACAGRLRAARGSVVNVASIVGLRPGPQPLAYAASKAAVVKPDPDAVPRAGARGPGQRGRAGLDRRGMDAAHARRRLRPADGAPGRLDADEAERHRGGRGRDDLLADRVPPVRDRRDGGDRRGLRRHDVSRHALMSPAR